MRSGAAIGVLVLGAITAVGCVSSGKYELAVADAEDAKNRAEKVQLQKKALEDEVKSLREQKSKLAADLELASAERQRLEDSLKKERGGVDARVNELEQRSRDLAAKSRALRQELASLKKQNESLKATVARYQKALKEPPASMPSAVPVPRKPPAAPAVAPTKPLPTAPKAGIAPVNVNTATANDMVLFLGIPKDVAEKIVANRPYKVRGGLLRVVPKATYDAIKDRISVTP